MPIDRIEPVWRIPDGQGRGLGIGIVGCGGIVQQGICPRISGRAYASSPSTTPTSSGPEPSPASSISPSCPRALKH